MSYIVNRLIHCLGGNGGVNSSSSVLHNWTPNNIKSIVIAPGYIIVHTHVGNDVYDLLNVDKVELDLFNAAKSEAGFKDTVGRVLKKKTLSCLEEVIIDKRILCLFDIQGYFSSFSNDTHRARYYGVGELPIKSFIWIKDRYQRSKNEKIYSYSLLEDGQLANISIVDLKNVNWFKNYNLRPQFYTLDGENKMLEKHFREVEKFIESQGPTTESIDKDDIVDQTLIDLIKKVGTKGKEDSVCKIVLSVLSSNREVVFKGDTDKGCLLITDELKKKGYSALVAMALYRSKGLIPNGKFKDTYYGKASLKESSEGLSFRYYLSSLVGFEF